MTLIIGYVAANGDMYMASDSAITCGNSIDLTKTPKHYRLGELYIGCAGSTKLAQIVQYSFVPPPHGAKVTDLQYLAGVFSTDLHLLLSERGMLCKDANDMEYVAGSFLIFYRGKFYEIQSNLNVFESIYPYLATGSGYQVAYGAFAALHEITTTVIHLETDYVVNRVMEIAADQVNTVCAPFNITKI